MNVDDLQTTARLQWFVSPGGQALLATDVDIHPPQTSLSAAVYQALVPIADAAREIELALEQAESHASRLRGFYLAAYAMDSIAQPYRSLYTLAHTAMPPRDAGDDYDLSQATSAFLHAFTAPIFRNVAGTFCDINRDKVNELDATQGHFRNLIGQATAIWDFFHVDPKLKIAYAAWTKNIQTVGESNPGKLLVFARELAVVHEILADALALMFRASPLHAAGWDLINTASSQIEGRLQTSGILDASQSITDWMCDQLDRLPPDVVAATGPLTLLRSNKLLVQVMQLCLSRKVAQSLDAATLPPFKRVTLLKYFGMVRAVADKTEALLKNFKPNIALPPPPPLTVDEALKAQGISFDKVTEALGGLPALCINLYQLLDAIQSVAQAPFGSLQQFKATTSAAGSALGLGTKVFKYVGLEAKEFAIFRLAKGLSLISGALDVADGVQKGSAATIVSGTLNCISGTALVLAEVGAAGEIIPVVGQVAGIIAAITSAVVTIRDESKPMTERYFKSMIAMLRSDYAKDMQDAGVSDKFEALAKVVERISYRPMAVVYTNVGSTRAQERHQFVTTIATLVGSWDTANAMVEL